MNNQSFPSTFIEDVTLSDGSRVTLRPIRPEDAPLLQEGFARLSPETIYLRFMETFSELTDKQAHQFATVDYSDRMAFVGTIQEDGEEHIVGVARYAAIEAELRTAEAAIVVRDDFHGRGLGTYLMERLTRYARIHDVEYFLATILMSNLKMLDWIRGSRLPYERKMLEPGTWEIRIRLSETNG